MFKYSLILFFCAALALTVTPAVRQIAIRCGAIDVPGGRRVHLRPTARFGGLAVYCAIVFGLLLASLANSLVADALRRHEKQLLILLAAATTMMVAGLIDDRYPLRPAVKLIVEIAAGIATVAAGFRIDSILQMQLGWLGPIVTVFWIVAVINAVNMVDGLDGLATGIGLIISATLFSISLYLGNIESSLILAALSGALVGFLFYNLHPARIFLGDSGSLLIGLLLAVCAVQSSSKAVTVTAIMWPLLALGLPLAEIVLTTLRRTLRIVQVVRLDELRQRYEFSMFGSAALFTADRDHIHHRLLETGFTYNRVVMILYGVCALSGVGAFLLVVDYHNVNVLLLLIAFGLVIIAVRQLNYRELQPLSSGILLPLFDLPAANRRVVGVLFDLGFISVSYLVAAAISAKDMPSAKLLPPFFAIIPLLAAAKIGCFILAGLYHRSYRYVGIADLLAIMKAIACATVGGWIVLFSAGHGTYPALNTVVLDAYLLATLLLCSRLSFRFLDHMFNLNRSGMRRVLIYGAGNGGVAALREIRSNPAIGMQAIGFLDDDPNKQGRVLQGVTVHESVKLRVLIEAHKPDAVVISTNKLPIERLEKIAQVCCEAGVMLRCFQITLEEIGNVSQMDSKDYVTIDLRAKMPQLTNY